MSSRKNVCFSATKVYSNKGYVIKNYDKYPSVENIKIYYQLTKEIELLPEIYSINGKQVKMEYIWGCNGYEMNEKGADIISALLEISKKLKMSAYNIKELNDCLYTRRMKNIFDACMKKLDYLGEIKVIYTEDKEMITSKIESMFLDANILWEQHLVSENIYVLHGDLHPGNMIFDSKRNMWRAIDPIVTVAPIEFEFVRFLQNLTYSQWHIRDEQYLDIDDGVKDIQTLITNYLSQLLLGNTMISSEKFIHALYIDSFLRTMETIVDCVDYNSFKTEIFKSISYCQMIRTLELIF